MKKVLEVNDLHVKFGIQGKELHAVRGINFSLFEGETIGIVGESGSGKSAAAKSLVKLLPEHTTEYSGEVWYQHENLLSFSESEMQTIRSDEIGMIFQDPLSFLNPTLKVGTQIIEGYLARFNDSSYEEAYEVTLEMLRHVGIQKAEEFMDAYPHTLSGGMRQRALIALALVRQPTILLADEPTTALDVTIQAQILDLMKQLQIETGMSIILITHDMSLAAQFCDRILVMYAGKIVESAPVDDLFHQAQHPYTKGLLQAIPSLHHDKDLALQPIEGCPPNLSLPLQFCSFCSRCPEAMNICKTMSPPLYPMADAHWSACFKHDPRRYL